MIGSIATCMVQRCILDMFSGSLPRDVGSCCGWIGACLCMCFNDALLDIQDRYGDMTLLCQKLQCLERLCLVVAQGIKRLAELPSEAGLLTSSARARLQRKLSKCS